MKVIDFRLRPPYMDFLDEKLGLFQENHPYVLRYFKLNGFPVPESLKQQSMELCLKEMDEADIAVSVVAGRVGISNDMLVSLHETYPNRFECIASYDVMKPEEGLEVIDKYIVNGPLKGLAIETMFNDITYAERNIFPVYEKMEQTGKFVILTAGSMGNYLELTQPEYIDEVARTFPNLKIVLSHAGYPWVIPTCWIAANRPNVYMMPDLYLCNAPSYKTFIDMINHQLQDRVIFGTAYPYNNLSYATSFARQHIRPEVQQKFMYETAAKLLGLEEK